MKPIIGITTELSIKTNQGRPWNSSRLLTSYCDAVTAADGVPVLLPLASAELCEALLERIDGIILSGGNDIPPEVLGEPAHPSLAAVPGTIDLVNIFRKSEDVFPIIEEAIARGAKAVWMQEGVINEQAAVRARESGLLVVMDRCWLKEHTVRSHRG